MAPASLVRMGPGPTTRGRGLIERYARRPHTLAGQRTGAIWLSQEPTGFPEPSALARIDPPPLTRNDPVRERHRQLDRVARGVLLLVWRGEHHSLARANSKDEARRPALRQAVRVPSGA